MCISPFKSDVVIALLDKIGASSTGVGDTTKPVYWSNECLHQLWPPGGSQEACAKTPVGCRSSDFQKQADSLTLSMQIAQQLVYTRRKARISTPWPESCHRTPSDEVPGRVLPAARPKSPACARRTCSRAEHVSFPCTRKTSTEFDSASVSIGCLDLSGNPPRPVRTNFRSHMTLGLLTRAAYVVQRTRPCQNALSLFTAFLVLRHVRVGYGGWHRDRLVIQESQRHISAHRVAVLPWRALGVLQSRRLYPSVGPCPVASPAHAS